MHSSKDIELITVTQYYDIELLTINGKSSLLKNSMTLGHCQTKINQIIQDPWMKPRKPQHLETIKTPNAIEISGFNYPLEGNMLHAISKTRCVLNYKNLWLLGEEPDNFTADFSRCTTMPCTAFGKPNIEVHTNVACL